MYGSCGSSSHRLWQHMRVWAAAAAAALLLLLGAAASAVAQVDARPAIGGTIAYVQRVGLAYEIHVQDLPGGSSRRVWRQEDGFIEALSLSRDATKIAFQASDFVGFWEYDIYVLRIGEDEARQVTELAALARATAPAWSPDGSRLAYGVEMQRQFPEASLFLAGPMGMGVAPFVDARALAYEHPSWSLDGRSIAFRKVDAERTSTIWRADVGAGETTALTHGPYALFPAWAPGGGRIVYATDSADGQSDLHVIDSRTGEHIRQITDDRVHERWPVWVDAWHIAFLPFDYADGDADRELRIVDLTGRERETITLADIGAHIEAFSWVDPARPVAAKGMDASLWAHLKQRDGAH